METLKFVSKSTKHGISIPQGLQRLKYAEVRSSNVFEQKMQSMSQGCPTLSKIKHKIKRLDHANSSMSEVES